PRLHPPWAPRPPRRRRRPIRDRSPGRRTGGPRPPGARGPGRQPGDRVRAMRWQVGEATITKVLEKEVHWPFSALLPDVTPEMIDEHPWMRPHYVDDQGKMVLSMHGLVIESEGRRILVDTCIGNDKVRPTRSFNQLQTSFLED